MKPIALMKTAAMLAALGLCVSIAPARAAQSKASGADAQTIASLMKELDQAEAELTRVEDVAAIKKLQRAYNFYIDKGMWADAADLFTNVPACISTTNTDARRAKSRSTWMIANGSARPMPSW